MSTIEISKASRALAMLEKYERLTGSVSRTMRTYADGALQPVRGLTNQAVAKQEAMLARTAYIAGHETMRTTRGGVRATFDGPCATLGRTVCDVLNERASLVDWLGQDRRRGTSHLFDRCIGGGQTYLAGASVRAQAVEAKAYQRRWPDLIGQGHDRSLATLDAIRGQSEATALAALQKSASVARVERALRPALREAQRALESVRLAAPVYALSGAPVLDSWQLTQLRTAQHDLRSAQDWAANVPNLAQVTQRRLSEIRSLLEAERAARRVLAITRAAYQDESVSGVLRAAIPGQATHGLVGSIAAYRAVADTYRLAGGSLFHEIRASRWLGVAGDLTRLHKDRAASVHWNTAVKSGWIVQPCRGDVSSLYRTGVAGRNLVDSHLGQLISDATRQSGVLGELGFVIADDPTAPAETELLSAEDESLTAIVAVVVWSQYALAELQTWSRTIATGSRLVVAQTGMVLRELGVTVVDKAEEVGDAIWTGPLWVVRAHLMLADHLTPDEQLALKQRTRELRFAVVGATATCLFMPLVAGSWQWLLAWFGVELKVRAFYEEIARLSHAHGLDELVPPEHRHDG